MKGVTWIAIACVGAIIIGHFAQIGELTASGFLTIIIIGLIYLMKEIKK